MKSNLDLSPLSNQIESGCTSARVIARSVTYSPLTAYFFRLQGPCNYQYVCASFVIFKSQKQRLHTAIVD